MRWSKSIYASRVVDVPIAQVAEHHIDIGHFEAVHGYHDASLSGPLKVGGCVLYAKYRARCPLGPWSLPVRFEVTLWGLDVAVTTSSMGAFRQRIQMNMVAIAPTSTRLELEVQVNHPFGFLLRPTANLYLRELDRDIARWSLATGQSSEPRVCAESHLAVFWQYARAQSARSTDVVSLPGLV